MADVAQRFEGVRAGAVQKVISACAKRDKPRGCVKTTLSKFGDDQYLGMSNVGLLEVDIHAAERSGPLCGIFNPELFRERQDTIFRKSLINMRHIFIFLHFSDPSDGCFRREIGFSVDTVFQFA